MPRDVYMDVGGRVEPGAETESDAGANAEDRMSGAAGVQEKLMNHPLLDPVSPCRSTGQARTG